MHKHKTFLALALLWTITITYLSLASSIKIADEITIPNKDKIAHFVFYFLFVFLWSNSSNPNSIKSSIKVLIIAICYGITMELCQKYFTTTRTPDVFDAIANSIGASFGFLAFKYQFNKKLEKSLH